MYIRKLIRGYFAALTVAAAFSLSACASSGHGTPDTPPPQSGAAPSAVTEPSAASPSSSANSPAADSTVVEESPIPASSTTQQEVILRDNTPHVPKQEAPGTESYSNDVTAVDVSNSSKGYCMAKYFGSNPKVKLIITGPDSVQYKYDLKEKDFIAFPFTAGDGSYSIGVYENVSGTSYSAAMKINVDVKLDDEFQPFLIPSQYVSYDEDCDTVAKGAELAKSATNDLEVVSGVYNYLIHNITYDYAKAENPPTGYISDVDSTLESGTGICLDYAAVMTSMLRSQNIPTKLEVGYAGDVYHAWISTYITDIGWVNNIIEFDGKSWKLMDPTFAANPNISEKKLREYIGDGKNYVISYEY